MPNASPAEQFAWIAKRNCSIAPAPLCALFVALAAVTLGIGLGWSWQGAWLVLPFAGIEVAALAAALVLHARHVGDFERISLREGLLVVEVREFDRIDRHEFNPDWARLVTTRAPAVRLAVRSHGRELEIGRHLDEVGRLRLAAELALRLRPARE